MLCWNRLPLSRRCLSSYLDTTTVSHELFVIDNASTDGTSLWLEEISDMPGVAGVLAMSENDPAAAINEGLSRCRGQLLHIMENDYTYLPGWDRYVLDYFDRIPGLGQLGLQKGRAHFPEVTNNGLVWVTRQNVCTSSVLRRGLFFNEGVRVRGHYLRKRYPDDYNLSMQVRGLGRIVAWPDRDLANHEGAGWREFERDPDYYIRNYALKLFSLSRLRGNWQSFNFSDTGVLVRRLLGACLLKCRRAFGRADKPDG